MAISTLLTWQLDVPRTIHSRRHRDTRHTTLRGPISGCVGYFAAYYHASYVIEIVASTCHDFMILAINFIIFLHPINMYKICFVNRIYTTVAQWISVSL